MAEGFFGRFLTNDIGIDLGTTTVLVYVKGRGIVLEEPSVALVEKGTDRIIKVGHAARKMMGKTPEGMEVVRPLRDGVINKYKVTLQMVEHFIKRACENTLVKPRVMVCIPSGVTEVEECAVLDAAAQAGARQTFLIEEPMAAAIGAGLNIDEPRGKMVVDIGGGTTDVAVMSLGEIVVSDSIKIAGDKFDEAIAAYVRKKYDVIISERQAEEIKLKVGAVYEHKEVKKTQVTGRCIRTGLPKTVTVSSKEMLGALAEPITAIIDTVCSVIARTPPELVGDILKTGIVMTGGGSLLLGFDRLIGQITGIPTRVAKDAQRCVAIGTGMRLEDLSTMQEGSLNLSLEREKRL